MSQQSEKDIFTGVARFAGDTFLFTRENFIMKNNVKCKQVAKRKFRVKALMVTLFLFPMMHIISSCNKQDSGCVLELSEDGSHYVVTSLKSEEITKVVIPDTYKNKPVQVIENSAFEDCDSIISLKIGNNIKVIGNYAFYDCDSITQIIIPESVISIGAKVFAKCSNLESIIFEDTSKWYRTRDKLDFAYKRDGEQTLVEDSFANILTFTEFFEDYYWYKE